MVAIPVNHRGEDHEADRESQVGAEPTKLASSCWLNHHVKGCTHRQEDRVILAQQRATPRYPHPDPGTDPFGCFQRGGEAIQCQKPEKEKRAVG